jgi:DNA-binding response OmpR family regulator
MLTGAGATVVDAAPKRATNETMQPETQKAPGLILMAEDDENDLFFLRQAFEEAKVEASLVRAPDVAAAIEFLLKCEAKMPRLVVVDLKMPVASGFGLLEWMRLQPRLNSIPRIVLSDSDRGEDRALAAELGATDYFQKPLSSAGIVEMVQQWHRRWLE